ncbi:MAG TPA: dTMP kinase [Gemmatimonadota bacterium]|nr:dTMP kinase [Gemmatimonadota bacterium]
MSAALRGTLVTFEGGEGGGKSTQTQLLGTWLEEKGYQSVVAREPGTTQVGEAVRRLLLEEAPDHLTAEAELLLYVAARAQLVAELVRPSLEAGKVVVLDRYGDSSVAYQGYGRRLEPEYVRGLNRWATGGIEPDLTILMDVAPEVETDRLEGRHRDRLERAGRTFHERVREGYLELAGKEPDRFFVVDAGRPIDEIQGVIRERVEMLLTRRRRPRKEP